MGNSRDVYERYYMPSFIDADCQAIYLGTTRREDLIRAVGRLERYDDAPDKLSDTQKKEISNYPYILKKVKARKSYVLKIKEDGYLIIKAAKEVLTPSTIEYELEERATVAKLLFQLLDELYEDQVFDIRV
ncbi:hypothetical protein BKA61DRAFT_644467 [Leptodontidium sp. MPI-SDFR-AT-0119]|nr:hypothetical protein BKA61DRAFT_644467 [Leptodontidium sp. MPI-SDFR-AT-0119]